MTDREIPASLRKTGLAGFTDNIPEGFAVNFHADFVRIFKDDIKRAARTPEQPAAVQDLSGTV